MRDSRRLAGGRLWIPVVVAASLMHAWITSARLDSSLYFDAIHTYLPLAREFVAAGWKSLLAPESGLAPADVYLWPALFAADPGTIKHAISLPVRWFRFCFSMQGEAALLLCGRFAACCMRLSADLALDSQVLSEPPFLVFTAAWIWRWPTSVMATRFCSGGRLACGLSLLTRPSGSIPC